MCEVAEGIKAGVAVVAVPGRGAHAIDYQRILFFGVVFSGVGMLDGVQRDVVCAAAVEFGEEGFEPVLLFEVDREGLVVVRRHDRILIGSLERRCTGGRPSSQKARWDSHMDVPAKPAAETPRTDEI